MKIKIEAIIEIPDELLKKENVTPERLCRDLNKAITEETEGVRQAGGDSFKVTFFSTEIVKE